MAEEIRKRSEIEDKYKWDLTHIYASDEAGDKDFNDVMAMTGTLSELFTITHSCARRPTIRTARRRR